MLQVRDQSVTTLTGGYNVVKHVGSHVVNQLRGSDGGRVDGHKVRQPQRPPLGIAQVYHHQLLFS